MAHITGNSSNVHINAADLVLTDTTKKLIAPKAELTNISGVSLTTTGRVGVSNVSPVHTLDVGANVYVDDTATGSDPVLNVIGRLKATTIDFQTGGTNGGIFFNDSGALNTDADGLSFNKTTDVLTVEGGIVTNGQLDVNSTADINNTLTLSKATGTGLDVTADATVGGALNVDGATTITTLSSNAITARGNLVVVNNDGTNNLIISAANGTSSVSGNFGVGGLATLNAGLKLTSGDSLLKNVYANATIITNGLTVSSGTTDVQALTATSGGFTGAVGIDGDFDIATNKFTVASASGNTAIAGTLDVTGATTLSTLETSGVSLLKAVHSNAMNVVGTLDASGATTLSTLETSGVSLLKAVHSNAMNVVGTLDASEAATFADNLTVRTSKLVVNGTGVTTDGTLNVQSGKLEVNSSVTTNIDLNVRSGKLLANDTGISTSGILDVAGVSRLDTVFANATTITDGLTVSDGGLTVAAGGLTVNSGTAQLQAMTATSATVSGTTIINGSGNALQVSNNATISGSLQVNGNLNVDGELTVLTTNNLVIQDPIIELGNVHAQGLGVSYDTGMVFTQPSGSNVATWYDISGSGTYRIAKTNNSAHDTTIETTGSIEVEVTGNLTSSGNVNASDALVTGDLSMGSGNIRISGNTIYFT